MPKTTKSKSEELQLLDNRAQCLDVCVYLGMGLALAGVVVGCLPESIGSVALVSTVQHRVGGVEVVVGLVIVFLANVMLRKARNRLKKISDIRLDAEPQPLRRDDGRLSTESALLRVFRCFSCF